MALPESLQRITFTHQTDAFDRGVIVSPDVLLDGDLRFIDVSASMLPLLDSVWQAAGRESTPYIDDRGRWLFAD